LTKADPSLNKSILNQISQIALIELNGGLPQGLFEAIDGSSIKGSEK
jgi:hypothetical protein